MRIKRAGFVTVGNEILSGAVADVNMRYFAWRALEGGTRVVSYRAVPDDEREIGRALKELAGKVDCVVVSGGLGPTDDDLTREGACRAFGAKLKVNKRELKKLEEYFKMRGFGFPESNIKQVSFPEGSQIIPNPAGTAPAFSFRFKRTMFYFLPGVPSEFKKIIDERVIPELSRALKAKVLSRTYRIFGLPESKIGELMSGRFEGFEVAFLPDFPEVHVKLTATKSGKMSAEAIFCEADRLMSEIFGDLIFSTNGDSMEKVVGQLLKEKGLRLAIAESITGGLIGHRLTEVPGSSDYFLASLVCYSNTAKVKLLGVSEETLRTKGAVSRETAIEMARGARRVNGADLGLSVTGIAGPTGGSGEKPVGTVYIGLSSYHIEGARHFLFGGLSRDKIKLLTAESALDILRRYLLGKKPVDG